MILSSGRTPRASRTLAVTAALALAAVASLGGAAIAGKPTPGPTMSPTFAATDFTVPSRGARSAFSIFIDSTTTSSSPRATRWPGDALTAITRPGIGASSPEAAARCAACARSPSSRKQ